MRWASYYAERQRCTDVAKRFLPAGDPARNTGRKKRHKAKLNPTRRRQKKRLREAGAFRKAFTNVVHIGMQFALRGLTGVIVGIPDDRYRSFDVMWSDGRMQAGCPWHSLIGAQL